MFETRSPPPRRGFWNDLYGNRRFSLLLVLLLSLLAGPALVLDAGISDGWFDDVMALLLLCVVASLGADHRQRAFSVLLGIPTIFFSLCGQRLPYQVSGPVVFLGQLCQMAFFSGAAALIVRSLFSSRRLSLDSVAGAVCGYLFLALAFAVGHLMIDRLRPGSYQVNPALMVSSDSLHLPPQLLTYYSFMTLTTVGYGDISPLRTGARTLAWVEAIAGQFYLAVVVAAIVSMIVASKDRVETTAE